MADEREDRRQRIGRLVAGLDMAIDWVLTLQDDIAELKGDIATLTGLRDDLVAALERLGSAEAFTYPRTFKKPQDDELLARMEFARNAPTKAKVNDECRL